MDNLTIELIEALTYYALNKGYKVGWVHYAAKDLKLPIKYVQLKELLENIQEDNKNPWINFNPYEVLQISTYCTFKEIKEAYYRQIRLYHPDSVNHLGKKLIKLANEQTQLINEAYNQLQEHGYKNN